MAETTQKELSIRLVGDVKDVQAKLKDVQIQLRDTLKAADQPAAEAKRSIEALKVVLGGAKETIHDTGDKLGVFATALRTLGPYGGIAAAGVAAIVASVTALARVAAENETVNHRLEMSLKATGMAAGLTATQIADFADELADATVFDDTAFKKAATQLTAFGAVSGDVFKGTLDSAADLAGFMGTDLSTATEKIGSVMQKLSLGNADGLRKSFAFLSAEQENMIRKFAEGGDTIKAEEALLAALQSKIGSAGDNNKNTLSGAITNLDHTWGNLIDSFGDTSSINGITSSLGGMTNALSDMIRAFSEWKFPSLDQQLDNTNIKIQELKNSISSLEVEVSKGGLTRYFRNQTLQESQASLAKLQAERGKILKDQDAVRMQEEIAKEQADINQRSEAAVRKAIAQQESEKAATAAARAEAERMTKARAEQSAAISLEIDANQRLLSAYYDGADAVKAVRMQLEIEQKVRQAGLDLTSAEGRAMAERVRQNSELEEAIKTTSEAQDKARKQAEDYAKQQEDLMIEPFKNAIEGIQGAFSDGFESIFEKGINGFEDMGATVKSVFVKMAAEVASLMVFRPVMGSVLGTVLPSTMMGSVLGSSPAAAAMGSGGGVDTQTLLSLGQLFGGGSASILNGVGAQLGFGNLYTPGVGWSAGLTSASLSSVLGAGGLGFMGGSLLASLIGLNSTGGGIGGGLGAGAGLAIGGPVGAIIGGLAGTVLGGLFGGSKPTNAAAFGNLNFDTGVAAYSHMNKGNSSENMGVLKQAFDQVMQFSQGFNQLGVGRITGKISGIDAGVRDTQKAYVNGEMVTAAAGQFGQLAINSLKKLLSQTNITNADVRKVVGTTDYSDLSKALTDIQFAATFRDQLKAYRDGLTAETQARQAALASAQQINSELGAFRDNVSRLGLDMNATNSSLAAYAERLLKGTSVTEQMTQLESQLLQERERLNALVPVLATQLGGTTASWQAKADTAYNNTKASLRTDFVQGIDMQILRLRDGKAYELAQLDVEFEGIRKDAVNLGADLAKIETLKAERIKEINLRYAQTTADGLNSVLSSAGKQLRSWLDSQLLGNLSSLAPTAQLAEAQKQFGVNMTAAKTGDSDALGSITARADALLNAAKSVYASGADYALIEKMVRSQLEGLGQTLKLPGFAAGTLSAPAGWAMVGERGPELVRLRGGERIYPHAATQTMMNGMDSSPVVSAVRDNTKMQAQGTMAVTETLERMRADIIELKSSIRLVLAR